MNEQNRSKEILNLVKSFLERNVMLFSFEEHYEELKFEQYISCEMKKLRGIRLNYSVTFYDDSYIVYADFPLIVNDEEIALNMSQFIGRINSNIINGNFEFSRSYGLIRYKTFVDCRAIRAAVQLSELKAAKMDSERWSDFEKGRQEEIFDSILRDSIFYPRDMYEYYIIGILVILFNSASADIAMRMCKICEEEKEKKQLVDDLERLHQEIAKLTTLIDVGVPDDRDS